jgi:hypothetical protein
MIQMAIAFKSGGVPWDPTAGHYVLDRESIVQRESPFQQGVYFVLNLPHFFKLAGGRDSFEEKMVWLPTWEQAREILRESGLSDQSLQSILHESDAIAEANELTKLYELIAERFPLSDSTDS